MYVSANTGTAHQQDTRGLLPAVANQIWDDATGTTMGIKNANMYFDSQALLEEGSVTEPDPS